MSKAEKRKAELKDACYIGLGIDPFARELVFMAGARDKARCLEKMASRATDDIAYRRVFVLDESTGPAVFAWLRECRIPEAEADRCVRGIGKVLLDACDLKEAKSRQNADVKG